MVVWARGIATIAGMNQDRHAPQQSAAASFRAAAPATADRSRCHRHADRRAEAHCSVCLSGVCLRCLVLDPDGAFCMGCMASRRAEVRSRLMQALWVMALAAIVCVAVLPRLRTHETVAQRMARLAAGMEAEARAARQPDGVDYGRRQYEAATMLKALKRNPCDANASAGMVRLEEDQGRHTSALLRAQSYVERCGLGLPNVSLWLARASHAVGDGNGTLDFLDAADAEDIPDDDMRVGGELLRLRAQALADLGDAPQAAEAGWRWAVAAGTLEAVDGAKATAAGAPVCLQANLRGWELNWTGAADSQERDALAQVRTDAGCPISHGWLVLPNAPEPQTLHVTGTTGTVLNGTLWAELPVTLVRASRVGWVEGQANAVRLPDVALTGMHAAKRWPLWELDTLTVQGQKANGKVVLAGVRVAVVPDDHLPNGVDVVLGQSALYGMYLTRLPDQDALQTWAGPPPPRTP